MNRVSHAMAAAGAVATNATPRTVDPAARREHE
jgi:hypothetical protein